MCHFLNVQTFALDEKLDTSISYLYFFCTTFFEQTMRDSCNRDQFSETVCVRKRERERVCVWEKEREEAILFVLNFGKYWSFKRFEKLRKHKSCSKSIHGEEKIYSLHAVFKPINILCTIVQNLKCKVYSSLPRIIVIFLIPIIPTTLLGSIWFIA